MNSLRELYKQHTGKSSDKWDIYLSTYENILSGHRSNIKRVLEIGVQNGGSLEIWGKYFNAAEHLVGCDINPECGKLKYHNPSIDIVIGNASTEDVKEKIKSLSPFFDLIIDDGSHLSSDIIKSFLLYFPLVTDDGFYIIEDLHASYWENFEGGLHYPYSSMAFLKKIADIPNHEHWGVRLSENDFIKPFNEFYNFEPKNLVDYSTIHSVTFINSLCIIRKKKAENNLLGARHIAGNEWGVFASNRHSQGRTINCLPQDNNRWSNLNTFPEMEWDNLITNSERKEKAIEEFKKNKKDLSDEFINKINILEIELADKAQLAEERLQELEALKNSKSWKITNPLRKLMSIIKSIKSI